MGDGDCGEAVKSVGLSILQSLSGGSAESGSIFAVLRIVIEAVDDMGGTLGAIMGILLTALAGALREVKAKAKEEGGSGDGDGDGSEVGLMDYFAPALVKAVESLKRHTGARVGDRTVMDVLIPFAETLEEGRDLGKAVRVAEERAEGTRGLKAGFGRASYVEETGGEEQRCPDPGAWALMVIVRGVYDAVEK